VEHAFNGCTLPAIKCNSLSVVSLLIGIVAVAGCVVVPLPHARPPVVYGNAIAEEALRASVVPGQPREEIARRLGEPVYDFGAGRARLYPWTIDQGSMTGLGPGGAILGPVTWAQAQVFIVVFDDDGRSLKAGTAEVPLYRSVSGVLRSWMVSERLVGYIRPQPQADPSAIVVYRRSSAPCDPRNHANEPYSPFAPAITVDGQTMGDLRKGELLRLDVAPGTHIVAAEAVPAFRRFEYEGVLTMLGRDVPASLAVEVGPRQTVYAEIWLCVEMDTDRTKPRYRMHVESRDAEQARAELPRLTSAWP